MNVKVRKHCYKASGSARKAVYGSEGRHAGKGLTYSAFAGGVLLSSSFRCLGISLFVSSSYLVANSFIYPDLPDLYTQFGVDKYSFW